MTLDPRLAYWTGALLNMLVLFACALAGIRAVRQRDARRHRRWMWLAASLVVLFLVSYVLKLAWLGREDLASWQPPFVWVLRLHELCVLSMLLGGARALWLAGRLRLVGRFDPGFDPGPLGRRIRAHRRAGWLAVGAAGAGVFTAAFVLWGMYARAFA